MKFKRLIKQIGLIALVSGTLLGVQRYGNSLFANGRFEPHGMCYIWYKPMIVGQVLADLMIFIAYTLIPITLFYLMQKQTDLPLTGLFWGFTIFIFFCGLTHLMSVVTVWHPYYWLDLAVKIITAVASIPTALYLAKLVPQILAMVRLKQRTTQMAERIEHYQPEEAAERLQELVNLLER